MSGIEKIIIAVILICLVGIGFSLNRTAEKQNAAMAVFMNDCLTDHKQYECDVLWSQTDASKQVRDAAIGVAAGAAIGAMAGRK